ncbi:MAG TPA: hypothetical protein VIL85_24870 [Thermomicrobiales bacterium]
MSDIITKDDLRVLRDEYDRKLQALQAEVMTLRRGKQRRRRPLLFIAPVVLFVALVPFSLVAAGPTFSDLGTAAPVHQPNIQAIGDAGITTGFEDPNNPSARLYDPKATVTREEMASFLARTAGLGTNLPVARAARLGVTNPTTTSPSFAANELVRTAQAKSTFTRDEDPSPPETELIVTKGRNDTTLDEIVRVTLTAPTAGFVIVSSTVGISIEGAGTVGFVRLRDTTASNGLVSPTLSAATNSGTVPTTAVATTLSPTYLFPVNAGPRSFVLEAQRSGPGPRVSVYDGVITAIFVPFGSSGATGLEGEQP